MAKNVKAIEGPETMNSNLSEFRRKLLEIDYDDEPMQSGGSGSKAAREGTGGGRGAGGGGGRRGERSEQLQARAVHDLPYRCIIQGRKDKARR